MADIIIDERNKRSAYASFGLELLRVSGRVGVSRCTSTPQLPDDHSVGDAEYSQRQQVGAGKDQQAVATTPHVTRFWPHLATVRDLGV